MFELMPFMRGARLISAYDPFKEMEAIEKRFFGRQAPAFTSDIRETKDGYIVEADLPGFDKENISVEIKNGYLTIRAERNNTNDQADEHDQYIRRERSYGSFQRCFSLEGIDEDTITASYKNGVLSLNLPKIKPPAEEVKTVEIQ